MRYEITLLTALITLTAFATANVWQPEESVDRTFETENYEIVIQEIEPGPATSMLEPYVRTQGKQTMILEPAPANKLVERCNMLDSYNLAPYKIDCSRLGR